MKKTILGLMAMLLICFVSAVEIESGDRLYPMCNNATSGELLGAAATITCRDSAGNIDVNGEALTNIATGEFYYVFSETNDTYGCKIDCPAGCVDYGIPVWQRTTPLIASDNIGINADDVSGSYATAAFEASFLTASLIAADAITSSELAANSITSSEIGTGAIDADAIAADAIGASEIAANAIGASEIAASAITTSEAPNLDAAVSSRSSHTAANVYEPINASLKSGLVVLTSATETQIDNIEADTDEIQGNQSNFLTAVGFSTHSAASVWSVGTRTLTTADWTTDSDITSLQSYGDANWSTAVGFSVHNAADVWSVATRSLTDWNNASDVYDYFTSGNNEDQFKADVSSLATTSKIDALNSSLQGYGDGNWSTATDFATSAQATDIINNQSTIYTKLGVIEADTNDLQLNQSDWITAVGFSTSAELSTFRTEVLANHSIINNNVNSVAADVWTVGSRTLTSFGTLVQDVFDKIVQSYNVTFNYDGNGFPDNDTYTYSDSSVVTETWGIDSNVIVNKTVVKS